MANIVRDRWENFHRNVQLTVTERASVIRDNDPLVRSNGPAAFAATAAVLKSLVADHMARNVPLGVIGSGWSLSNLIGMEPAQLETDQLDTLAWLADEDLHPGSTLVADACVYAGGGTKVYQLSNFGENAHSPYSLSTCGSYLGQSLAGSTATGVNGSALGYGAFQNQVRGLHLVVSGDQSVWLEPGSAPVLTDEAAYRFADKIVRDDSLFDAALVHLGGMGIVNGMVAELTPTRLFSLWRRRATIGEAEIAAMQNGDFHALSRAVGWNASPSYYEVQIDPFAPLTSPALHTFFFPVSLEQAGTPLAGFGKTFDGIGQSALSNDGAEFAIETNQSLGPPMDIFGYYSEHFFEPSAGEAPIGRSTWGQLHANPPKDFLRALVHTSAFAISRDDLAQALPIMCHAVQSVLAAQPRPRHILYTLRFVTAARGAMAFTQYPQTVVVDMEGLMESAASTEFAEATMDALKAAGIHFSRHWGKLLPPGREEIEWAFGPSTDPSSRLARWIDARNKLVPHAARRVLTTRALREWGLEGAAPGAV